jgi:hypothetical protein
MAYAGFTGGSYVDPYTKQLTNNPSVGSGVGGYDNLLVGGIPAKASTLSVLPDNTSGAATSGTYTDPAADAVKAQNAAVVAQLQGQLGQLDPQQAIGLQNIGNSYNLSANRLDSQNAAARANYDTGVKQNQQTYSNNRTGILQNTRAQAMALQRILGMNGSGNSSAAYEQAPYLAGLMGSQQLQGAQQTFGNNQSALDTNWQATQRSYKDSMDDLNNQRYQQENALRSSIAQTKATLLDKIAQANNNPTQYVGDISALLQQITQLGNQYQNPVMRTPDISYTNPDLSTWYLNGGQGANFNPQTPAQSDLSPVFTGLLTGQRDQYGNLIQ